MSAWQRRLIMRARLLCGGGLPLDNSGPLAVFLLRFRGSNQLLPCVGSAVRSGEGRSIASQGRGRFHEMQHHGVKLVRAWPCGHAKLRCAPLEGKHPASSGKQVRRRLGC
jgi:hypothetical protein